MAKTIAIDAYILDALMRDIVGHDRSPSAFLVYLHLYGRASGRSTAAVATSHQTMAELTGLSKSAVQSGIRILVRRGLVRVHKATVTAVPQYRIARTWR